MVSNIEDRHGYFSVDSGDLSKVNAKGTDFVEKIPSTNFSKDKSCNTPSEGMALLIDHKISEEKKPYEQMKPNIFTTKTLSTTDKNFRNPMSEKGENNITKLGDVPKTSARAETSKKSTRTKTDKVQKRVQFKSEVETYTFESNLSIRESYNYTEEFSLENVVADVFNERRFLTAGVNNTLWENESKTDVNSTQCPIKEQLLKCDRHFHHLNKEHLPIPVYSKLKDEDSSVSKNNVKGWSGLKKSSSCFFRKNKNKNENESQSLSRRLSMSMHNLKLETKSWFDKFVTKVAKKKTENLPAGKSLYIDVGDLAGFLDKEPNGPKIKKTRRSSLRKNWEVGSQNAVSGKLALHPWITVQNPKLKRTFSLPDLSKINTEDIIDDREKEVKGWTRFATRGGLFQKKRNKNKTRDDINLRAWKSTKSLHFDSKSLMDKFMMKVMKK